MEQKGRVKSETGGIQMGTFRIIKGDITKCRADAIVNAANPSLLGGGGVDGAIHRAAGPELLEECRTLNGCRPGEAKITKGYRLPADYVIHTPGPVYRGGNCGEEQILASCYRNSLKLAACYERNTVAFPSISTGIYGYPVSLAAKTAVREILTFLHTQSTVREVVMVCFDEETKKAYEEAYQEIGQTEFVIRKAGGADLADIQKLMETTVAYMENPDWFYEDGKEFLETCVKEEGIFKRTAAFVGAYGYGSCGSSLPRASSAGQDDGSLRRGNEETGHALSAGDRSSGQPVQPFQCAEAGLRNSGDERKIRQIASPYSL